MATNGYLLLWRRFFEHRFWREPRVFSRAEAWIDFIGMAAWKTHTTIVKGVRIQLRRGEVLAPVRYLARRWSWSHGRVERWILDARSMDEIRPFRRHAGGDTYLIVRYDDYQPRGDGGGDGDGDTNGTQTARRRGHSRIKGNEGKEVTDVRSADFEAAWRDYPKRPNNNKARARRAWEARINEGSDPAAIRQGVQRYARYVEANRCEPRFIKQAATFFGPDKHWTEDYSLPKAGPVRLNGPPVFDYSDASQTFQGFGP